VADAGYDSEGNHGFARDEKGIHTIIPAEHGRPTEKLPSGRYRRLMKVRFVRTAYRRRGQVETVISMIKRRQGADVYARTYQNQCRELRLLDLTHNIMILVMVEDFYTAVLTPYCPPHCIGRADPVRAPSESRRMVGASTRKRWHVDTWHRCGQFMIIAALFEPRLADHPHQTARIIPHPINAGSTPRIGGRLNCARQPANSPNAPNKTNASPSGIASTAHSLS
jgi:hypothetical protein